MRRALIGLFFSFSLVFLSAQADVWEDTHGPAGGDVLGVVAPSSGVLLAGMMDSVYRSTDGGLNWTLQGEPGMGVLAFLAHSTGTVFAGTYQNGLYRSDDGGLGWTPSGIFNGRVFAVAENQAGHVFVGMKDHGVLRSIDGGHTWAMLTEDVAPFTNVLSLLVDHQGRIFAGTYYATGIYRSTDNGDTWTPASNGFTGNYVYNLVEDASGRIYAAGGAGVFRSVDGGDNWAPWNDGFPDYPGIGALARGPSDVLYARCEKKIYRRAADAAAWELIGDHGASPVDLLNIYAHPDGDVFVGTAGGGLLVYSTAGASWRKVSSGIVADLLFDGEQALFAGTDAGVYRRPAGSTAWSHCADHAAFAYPVKALALGEGGAVFAGTDGGGVLRTTDGGQSWEAVNAGLSSLAVRSLLFDQGDLLAGTDGQGIFRLSRGAAAWEASGLAGLAVWSLARGTDGVLFAGTYGESAFRSDDRGITWNPARIGYSYLKYVYAMVPGNRGEMFAGTLGGFFRLPRNATAWEELKSRWTVSAAITPDDDYIAGMWTQNVDLSRNHGASWTEINYGLSNKYVNVFRFDGQGYLYAGTGGGGVCRTIRPIRPKGDGDVNADERVDSADLTVCLLQQAGTVAPGTPPFSGSFQDGDLNGDSVLDALDLALLGHRLAGFSDPYRND